MPINAPPLVQPLPTIKDTFDPSKVRGTLTLSAGGAFQTAETGQRIAMVEGTSDRIKLYSGDDFEGSGGTIRPDAAGTSGSTMTLATLLFAPVTVGESNTMGMSIKTESEDDSTTPPEIVLFYGGGSAQVPQLKLQNGITIKVDSLGSLTDLVLGMGAGHDDGYYSPTAGTIGVVLAGVGKARWESNRLDLNQGDLDFLTIPVKSDTGDPSGGQEGDNYINRADNSWRFFADGSWRDGPTW